jgi:hypothetical protein
MLINPDEVVTGALVNAIAVIGRQIAKAAAGLRKPGTNLATARWFETFRLTGSPPDLPELSPVSTEHFARILNSDEVQAALQELLAARLTDAPETDASQKREAVRAALTAASPDAATVAPALAGYCSNNKEKERLYSTLLLAGVAPADQRIMKPLKPTSSRPVVRYLSVDSVAGIGLKHGRPRTIGQGAVIPTVHTRMSH